MKIRHTKMYKTSIIADSGKIFDKDKLLSSDILNDDEKKTLRVVFDGFAIEWLSSFDISDMSEEDIRDIFKDVMVYSN